jgi:hypothetical protein
MSKPSHVPALGSEGPGGTLAERDNALLPRRLSHPPSNPLLIRAWHVWRFVLDRGEGRGFWAAKYYPLATGLAKPP